MSLAEALERAASALPALADAIRPSNGDPDRLLETLSSEGAAEVATWLLNEDPDAAAELLDVWREREEGAAVLAGLSDAGLPKAGRKALRRVRHHLRSRGVALEEAPAEPRVAHLPSRDEDDVEGTWVSPVDPTGAQLVTFVDTPPGGGARIFQLATDLRKGVLECHVYSSTRGRVRRFIKDLVEREQFQSVPVSREAARARVGRAVAVQPGDRPLPRAFAEWRSHLADESGEAATPGQLAREALGAEVSVAATRRVVERYRERELGPWLPAEAGLRAVAEELQGLRESKIVVSGAQRREQAEGILRDAMPTLFDEAEREAVAAWLEETAFGLWHGGREDEARDALAAAQAVRERPPAEDELLRVLLETALGPLMASLLEEEQERESSSLLVKP